MEKAFASWYFSSINNQVLGGGGEDFRNFLAHAN